MPVVPPRGYSLHQIKHHLMFHLKWANLSITINLKAIIFHIQRFLMLLGLSVCIFALFKGHADLKYQIPTCLLHNPFFCTADVIDGDIK